MCNLATATPEQITDYAKRATKWYEDSRINFLSFRNCTIEAVAEFMANQDGKTLIPTYNEDDEPE